MQIRELTGRERQRISRLVRAECANFDAEYGCLPLDSPCFIFGKAFSNGALCKVFCDAVMPLDPELERIFIGGIAPDTKPCVVCGKAFPLNGRQSYSSESCVRTNRCKAVAHNMKTYRNRKRRYVIN